MKTTIESNPKEAARLTQETVDAVKASIGMQWARQAIETWYMGPTNTKGSRYKATCERGTIIVAADHGLHVYENHIEAAKALVAKFVAEDAEKYGTVDVNPWSMPFVSGGLPDGGYCHVFLSQQLVGLVAKGVRA